MGKLYGPLEETKAVWLTIGDIDALLKSDEFLSSKGSPSPYNGDHWGTMRIREIHGTHPRLMECSSSSRWWSSDYPTDDTMRTPEEEYRYICMATVRHDRGTTTDSQTQTQYPGRIPPGPTKKEGLGSGTSQGPSGRGTEASEAGIYAMSTNQEVTFSSASWTHTWAISDTKWQEMDEEENGPSIPLMEFNCPEGIKLCPEKIEDVFGKKLSIPRDNRRSEPQREVSGLNWFLSKSAFKSLATLQNLKSMHKKAISLDTEAEQAFKN
ncbi:hypothetical protein Tco_0487622 [Tanacetum coccineum]